MTEKEIKVMLTENQYNVLKEFFHWNEVISQVNHYYINADTDSGKNSLSESETKTQNIFFK